MWILEGKTLAAAISKEIRRRESRCERGKNVQDIVYSLFIRDRGTRAYGRTGE
jgi:hypothetical protein